MKGSTVDAMASGADNAEVMLSCISLKYKESANCRLEAQYAHQQSVDMIPLLVEKGYKASGWLGKPESVVVSVYLSQSQCVAVHLDSCTVRAEINRPFETMHE